MSTLFDSLTVRFEVGFGSTVNTPAADIQWTDVMDRVIQSEVVVRRGRDGDMHELEAGTLQGLILDSSDGALWPDWPGSPYAGPTLGRGMPLRMLTQVEGATGWQTLFTGFVLSWSPRFEGPLPEARIDVTAADRLLPLLESPARRTYGDVVRDEVTTASEQGVRLSSFTESGPGFTAQRERLLYPAARTALVSAETWASVAVEPDGFIGTGARQARSTKAGVASSADNSATSGACWVRVDSGSDPSQAHPVYWSGSGNDTGDYYAVQQNNTIDTVKGPFDDSRVALRFGSDFAGALTQLENGTWTVSARTTRNDPAIAMPEVLDNSNYRKNVEHRQNEDHTNITIGTAPRNYAPQPVAGMTGWSATASTGTVTVTDVGGPAATVWGRSSSGAWSQRTEGGRFARVVPSAGTGTAVTLTSPMVTLPATGEGWWTAMARVAHEGSTTFPAAALWVDLYDTAGTFLSSIAPGNRSGAPVLVANALAAAPEARKARLRINVPAGDAPEAGVLVGDVGLYDHRTDAREAPSDRVSMRDAPARWWAPGTQVRRVFVSTLAAQEALHGATGSMMSGQSRLLFSAPIPSDSEWHHVAWDAAQPAIWVDGVRKDDAAHIAGTRGTFFPGGTNTRIGVANSAARAVTVDELLISPLVVRMNDGTAARLVKEGWRARALQGGEPPAPASPQYFPSERPAWLAADWLLDVAGWPADNRVLSMTATTALCTVPHLDGQDKPSPGAEIATMVTGEYGTAHVDRGGHFVLRQRRWWDRPAVDATFHGLGSGEAGADEGLPYQGDLELVFDDARVVTAVVATRTAGNNDRPEQFDFMGYPTRQVDSAAVELQGYREATLSAPWGLGSGPQLTANEYLALWSRPRLRVGSLSISWNRIEDPAWLADLLTREPGDLVAVHVPIPGGGGLWHRMVIARVEHSTSGAVGRSTFALAPLPLEPEVMEPPVATVPSAEVGIFDQSTFDSAVFGVEDDFWPTQEAATGPDLFPISGG